MTYNQCLSEHLSSSIDSSASTMVHDWNVTLRVWEREREREREREMGYLAKWLWDANFFKEIIITFVKNLPPKLENMAMKSGTEPDFRLKGEQNIR